MARKRRHTVVDSTNEIVKFIPKKTRRGVKLSAVRLSDAPTSSPSTSRSTSRSPSKSQNTSRSPSKSPSKLQHFRDDSDRWTQDIDLPSLALPRGRQRFTGKSQNDYMREWLPVRDQFLEELLKMEGWDPTLCAMCKEQPGILRCVDCVPSIVVCQSCCIGAHKHMPFHRLEKWTGQFFESTSLTDEGFIMYLGHGGDPCPASTNAIQPASESFHFCRNDAQGSKTMYPVVDQLVVVDNLGINNMAVSWCQCSHNNDKPFQLLRAKLFPTTMKRPSSAFTFQVLEYFHIDSVECKTSAMTFYSKLRRLTDYISPQDVPDRYRELMRVSRQWRNLQALIRAGIGHDKDIVRSPGDLAIFCPACPQPGVNLKDDWQTDPDQWLYWRSMVIDGNFKAEHLKMRNPGDDVALTDGALYMVSPYNYERHLAQAKETYLRSNCNNHKAVNRVNESRQHLEATGIGAVACARHGCFFPHSVVDFQKGERQMNVDYAICEALQQTASSERVLAIYDIACQWSVHFDQRVDVGDMLHKPASQIVIPAIGKFHLGAHVPECFPQFTLNFIKGAAQIDGEILETLWWPIDRVASVTRAMTKAHRREVLDDNMYDSNWKKWRGITSALAKKTKRAINMEQTMRAAYDDLSATLHKDWIAEWMIIEQNALDRQPDALKLYTVQASHALSQAEARAKLENHASAVEGLDTTILWLTDGIAIQEAQIKLKIQIAKLGKRLSQGQRDTIAANRSQLVERIVAFHRQGSFLIPSASGEEVEDLPHMNVDMHELQLEDEVEILPDDEEVTEDLDAGDNFDDLETEPEKTSILLPSSLKSDQIDRLLLIGIAYQEAVLREGQANDALEGLRNALGEKSLIFRTQVRNGKSQKKSTKSWDAIHRINQRIKVQLHLYHNARMALRQLRASEDVQNKFQDIKKEDLKMSGDIVEENRFGQRTEVVAWFWRLGSNGLQTEDEWMKEYYRITWLRTKARADRWTEEVQLLRKEMEWTVGTFGYWRRRWEERIKSMEIENGKGGHIAYAWREVKKWETFIGRANGTFSELD